MDRDSLLQLLEDEESSSPDTNPEVMEMVREQLRRDPPPPLSALYGRAVRIDPEIRNLDLRQFNAKYPLQVRRQKKRAERKDDGGSPPSAGGGTGTGPDAAEAPSEGAGRRPEGGQGKAGSADRGADASAEAQALRGRVREILIQYAKAIARAETRSELLEAILQAETHADTLAHLASSP